MDEIRKNAYRDLLYKAMLDIRMFCQSRGSESYNPWEWRRQYRGSRLAGAIADWLHNLAFYASRDFNGFDEVRFWREYEGLARRFQVLDKGGFMDYRCHFEEGLDRLSGAEPA